MNNYVSFGTNTKDVTNSVFKYDYSDVLSDPYSFVFNDSTARHVITISADALVTDGDVNLENQYKIK